MKIIALLVVFIPSLILAEDVNSIPLRDAVLKAIKNHPDVEIANLERRVSAEEVRSLSSAFYWPSFRSNLSLITSKAPGVLLTDVGTTSSIIRDDTSSWSTGLYSKLPTETELFTEFSTDRTGTNSANALISPYYSSRLKFGGTQRLLRGFDWFGSHLGDTWSSLRSAKALDRSAIEALSEKLSAFISQVESTYWALAAARQKSEIRKKALEVTQEQLDFTKKKIEAGLIVAAESFQVEERVAKRRGDLLEAVRDEERLREQLRNFLTNEDVIYPSEPLSGEAPEENFESLTTEIESHSPELRKLEFQAQNLELEVARSRSAILPTMDIAGAFFLNGGNSIASSSQIGSRGTYSGDLGELTSGRSNGWEISGLFEVPLGPSPALHEYRAKKMRLEQSRLQIGSAKNQLHTMAKQKFSEMKAEYELVQAAQQTMSFAQQKLDFENRKYAAGLTTPFQVLQAQEYLTDAQVKEIDALLLYRQVRINLDLVAGRFPGRYDLMLETQNTN